MKNPKLLTLALAFAAATLTAQTADQYVTQGRTALAAQDLAGAYSNFTAAVTLSSTNQTANALLAVTRLLVLPQQPAGSNFLNSLGFAKAGRNIYNWTSSLPVDISGNTIIPNINTAVGVAFYRTNIMLALGASWTNLSRITDPGFTLSLTAGETSVQSVTVDHGDFLLMQAELDAALFLGYTLNAHNFNVVITHLQNLSQTNDLTIQQVLADYPSLLTQNSLTDLTNSVVPFTNAMAIYLAASDFIRNTRPPGQGLFVLEPADATDEALFRNNLTNALLSLSQPVQVDTNSTVEVYAGPYFAGAKPLRSLVPKFNGDTYVNATVPDYTFGGILVNEPAYQTEAAFRRAYYSFAGTYIGLGGLSDSSGYGGDFSVFVGTNNQAVLVGTDYGDGTDDGTPFGLYVPFPLDNKGNWSFQSNSVSGDGSLGKDGSLNGELFFTNGISVYFYGTLQPTLGAFQNTAGYYSGTFNGYHSGNIYAVVAADGEVFFCPVSTSGSPGQGGASQFYSNNLFSNTSISGSVVTGTLTNATLKIGGTYTNTDATGGRFLLTRAVAVPFDVPPVITANLPAAKSAPLGTNVTFSLTATGSPPMCFQWYDNNGAIIPYATTNTLVVSNLLYSSAGTYSVVINNVVGETNAAAALTVTAETILPVVSITNITPGMNVSNATLIAKGTASDNVAVSNVFYSLNNGPWTQATPVNQWANWSATLTLLPGSNTIAAIAVDTSDNLSATNQILFNYVVSAPLSVSTNGVGSLSPNDNGALLQIGKNYAITAAVVAGSGFAFTNWTGGTGLPLTLVTNGTTVQFQMVSNLLLQANFVDTNKPVLAITNATTGLQVSNANFVVQGTATDNVAVAAVYCQLNGNGFSSATSFNGRNWTDAVTLNSGTNLFQAYAADVSGNLSPTNSVNLVYVVSASLTVSTNGLGSMNPNDNGAILQIGKNYAITATPASGFMFTNWTGGTNLPLALLTNGPIVQFLMASNLMLQASFVDTNRPLISITNLTAGQRWSNFVFTAKGTATDNWQVASVQYQLNGSAWASATGTTNWSAPLNLTPGTNTIAAFATDTSGNNSLTNSVSFDFAVTNQLGIRALGLGTLSPNYSNAWLELGRNYSITSAPASGFVFTNWLVATNWLGGTKVGGTNLTFMMTSNLSLQAYFLDVTRPLLTITAPSAGQHMTNALAAIIGTASDNWNVTAVWYQLTNTLRPAGTWQLGTTTNGFTNWTTTITLAAGTNQVSAYALDPAGNSSPTNSVSVVSSNTFQLQLKFAGTPPLSANGLNFGLQISPGLNGHIQISTNLLDWVTLTNFVGSNSSLNFRDPAATNSNRRFYRAVIP